MNYAWLSRSWSITKEQTFRNILLQTEVFQAMFPLVERRTSPALFDFGIAIPYLVMEPAHTTPDTVYQEITNGDLTLGICHSSHISYLDHTLCSFAINLSLLK